MTSMNPFRRQEWQLDEAYQPTFHRQQEEMAEVRKLASRMSSSDQDHWAGEMEHILRTHNNPLLRAEAVKTLAALSTPSADRALQLAGEDDDANVRIAACRAWGQRGGKDSVAALARILGSDTDLDVRITCAGELAAFSDPVAYRALGLAIDEDNPALTWRAIRSLRTSSGRDFGNNLAAWQQFAQGSDPGPDTPLSIAERLRGLF
jgi:HEAT repeat protein